MTDTVKEKSTAYLTVTFKDKAGVAAVPTSATYRIDCLATGTEILADTAMTPIASPFEITLTPAQNAILGGAATERKRVTVKASFGASDGDNDYYDYDVINLSGVT